ncbi:pentapeptide repeat-containing protein [Thioclava sp. FR2]|uniref:pentapeptide repeat-containing protein n=1 Tax=Thioclava sp. FR2 TaxID=3445780 RepID=UPI003EBE4E98
MEADFSKEYRGYRLDLREGNFQAADIPEIDLSLARLMKVRFEGANLERAVLDRAYLSEAKLNGANLSKASIKFARFWQADLSGTDMEGADLTGSGLSLMVPQVVYLSQKQANACFADLSVKLPTGISRPAHWASEILDYTSFSRLLQRWRDQRSS